MLLLRLLFRSEISIFAFISIKVVSKFGLGLAAVLPRRFEWSLISIFARLSSGARSKFRLGEQHQNFDSSVISIARRRRVDENEEKDEEDEKERLAG